MLDFHENIENFEFWEEDMIPVHMNETLKRHCYENSGIIQVKVHVVKEAKHINII